MVFGFIQKFFSDKTRIRIFILSTLLHTNADVVGGQNLYKIELIVLFYRKTFNSHKSYKCSGCWRTEPHHYMLCIQAKSIPLTSKKRT
jgi:hypothetical protein